MSTAFTLNSGIAYNVAIGIVVLQRDETLEAEFRGIFRDEGLGLFHTRIPSPEEVTPETLIEMEANLPRALALLPVARPLDVAAYACTSGATFIGQHRISEIIRAVHPQAQPTDPITAVIAACRHLGVCRLGLLTPYVPDVSAGMQDLIGGHDIEITDFASFEQSDETVVARISPASVFEAICKVGNSEDVDAVFASCTNLQTLSIIDAAEAQIGKPVITSNSALAWHIRKLANLPSLPDGPGQLLRR